MRFRRHNHLKKRKDFLAVRNGFLYPTSRFILQARLRSAQDQEGIRFGLTATRKIGGAVERNRMRRRLWAVIRHVFADWISLPPFDIVLIIRPATLTVPFAVLETDFSRSLNFLKETLQSVYETLPHEPHVAEGQEVWTPAAHLPQVLQPPLPLSIQ